MSDFISLTRIYKTKATGEMKTQPITVAVAAVSSVRPSNRLGYPEHRTTITLIGGAEIDIAEKFSEVNALIGA